MHELGDLIFRSGTVVCWRFILPRHVPTFGAGCFGSFRYRQERLWDMVRQSSLVYRVEADVVQLFDRYGSTHQSDKSHP